MPIDVAATLDVVLPTTGGWTRRQVLGGAAEQTSQGAELWASASGRLVVVKHFPDAASERFDAVARRIEALRQAGVPAPATTVAAYGEGALLVHDYVNGQADPVLTAPLVDDLLRIVERQAGLADDSASQWPELIRTTLSTGVDGYKDHRSLQEFNAASRALLHRIHEVGNDPAVGRLSAADLVHYDLHTQNIVSDDGQHVSGIIDWDAVRAGDRSLDLANIAFTSLWKTSDVALHGRLWTAFLTSSNHDARVVYAHLVALSQVDVVIREPQLSPGPARTIELARWAIAITEDGAFSPPP